MAGRIRDEDIAEVREKARIDDVVSAYVTLRNAGGGSMKGLCPFHDEKSPSFHVTPSRGMYYCFGCQAGGDVIKFVQEMDGLSFTETVERLAEKAGVTLRYEEGGPQRPSGGPARPRLVEAHRLTEEWYREQLATPAGLTARQFLDARGFDQAAADHFGVGFSPRGGEDLLRHLRQKGFSDKELVASGLIGEGRGLYDRFRGRLMWPIRDSSGDTIGFGARRIFDDDRIEAKYLNTPETSIYKKSHVLYGLDLARREIAKQSQAVIVEGYTDVMACHLAGIPTAVASCGTAFGDDHARIIRRLLHDHDEFRGEVIFTFDGDAAGQKAALKAFEGDQVFAGQTYVAVAESGLDPCDLRLQKGDEAVLELVSSRTPLYRFVLSNVIERFDLDRADGRIDAVREAARLVSSIRDRSKVDAFSRELAGMVGVDPDDVRREVRRASQRATDQRGQQTPTTGRAMRPAEAPPVEQPAPPPPLLPDPRDPKLTIERDTLKLVVQHPGVVGRLTLEVTTEDFTHPAHQFVWAAVQQLGGPTAAQPTWASDLQGAADPRVQPLISALAVEPIRTFEATTGYVRQHVLRLRELTLMRRIADQKSRLQRTDPDDPSYQLLFADLVGLEQQRRALRDQALETE